jgi:glycosyltransferase involved in cell wall biosynthesis
MDVLVLPSRTVQGKWKEQFGHVLIEAMAMGIPVVGSSSGAIPDVIGKNELIFNEDDIKGLASILEKLAVNPKWRAQISQYVLDRVRENFTHETLAMQLVSFWNQIVKY